MHQKQLEIKHSPTPAYNVLQCSNELELEVACSLHTLSRGLHVSGLNTPLHDSCVTALDEAISEDDGHSDDDPTLPSVDQFDELVDTFYCNDDNRSLLPNEERDHSRHSKENSPSRHNGTAVEAASSDFALFSPALNCNYGL